MVSDPARNKADRHAIMTEKAAKSPKIPIDPGAAKRALAEAEARKAAAKAAPEKPREINGRKGPDPARYGDWEVKGIASDF